MNKKKRQETILLYIEDNQDISMSELVILFDETIDRRTLQRDLNELEHQGFISITGSGRSVRYQLSAMSAILHDIDVEEYFNEHYLSRDIKESFDFSIFDTLSKGAVFSLEEQHELEHLHAQFIQNISNYDSQTIINKEYERIMIEFSWKSSAIEGNTYSLLATEALLREHVKDETKTDEETQMILNHKDAFNEAIQNKDRFLSLSMMDLECIHSVLTKHIGIRKNIRSVGVGISGSKYRPLDNEIQIKDALRGMIDLINNKESFFEKSFLALLLLSYIQAFEDGNKRTARTFSNAILLAHNSIPLSYRIVDIVEYKKATLLFYEQHNISYLKKIYIEQFRDAVKNYFVPTN